MEKKRLIIIDGFSLIYRMFYGVRPMSTKDGIPTNVVYGFANILITILESFQPDFIGVAFDEKKPTFRHDTYEAYKAGRLLMPEDLEIQVDYVMEMLEKMDIHKISMEGYEADDLIGTVAKICSDNGMEVDILTGDRDAFQLIDDNIHVLFTKKGISELDEITRETIFQDYGLSPKDLIDVKGLMGDKSDNIPGVAGVGEKTALKLIQTYGDMESVYENLDEIKGKLKEKLETDRENAFLSRHLVKIIQDVPIDFDLNNYTTLVYNTPEVLAFFEKLECYSIVKRLQGDEEFLEGAKETTNHEIIEVVEEKQLKKLVETMLSRPKVPFVYFTEKTDVVELKAFAVCMDQVCHYVTATAFDQETLAKTLAPFFRSKKTAKAGYDVKAIYTWLFQWDISLNGLMFDGFLAAYLLDPSDNRYGFHEVSSKYLDVTIPSEDDVFGKGKNQTTFDETDEEKTRDLLCTRAALMDDLQMALEKAIEESQMNHLFQDIELPLVEVLASFEYEGFNVDLEELRRLDEEFDKTLEELTEKIYKLTGETFNINSTKQLGEVLFDKLQLPVQKKTKTGYSTNAEVLEKLKGMHPVIEEILDYRTVSKLSSTYVKGLKQFVNKRTGRIHSTFNQALTTTGRISSSDPNLQNIPIKIEIGRKIRKVFIPFEKDHVLLDADYSQIELRVLAHISEDKTLMESFVQGEDIHSRTASEIFGVALENVKPKQRMFAKAINFGLIYGKQAYGLSQDLGISRKEAQEYIDTYFGRYPNVEKYMKDIVEKAKADGFVTTISGRRRFIPEIHSRNAMIAKSGERLALNTPIQGSAADIMKIAMINVYHRLRKEERRSKLILTVHDELVLDCPKDEIADVKKIVVEEMEQAFQLKVPMTVDISEGANWYEAK
ncbi:DNA polymerase I [Alkalibacter rhizosphaerae]|uniref:DNA polymerase I n=1 Tax=Alkalibacter rhizosphaerae TaxID=2815577 RepID=A0A975AIQ2_9FIRM|nr:DNA polymerase I [Alkalibacter rhizosphaerae]QSX09727.1 DNA polymerase I [Alkalibacter rhizosphaerae]